MNRLSLLGISLITIVLNGCASLDVTPPISYDVERNRVYNMNYESTWLKSVDWFADHNVTIEKIEKTSGLITAKYRLQADETFLDCGNIQTRGTVEPEINRSGSLNVTVRENSDSQTTVNVNFSGDFEFFALDVWTSRTITTSGVCVSTGEIERWILDFIGNK